MFLALAGAYPKNPVSVFGHVFLVIAPQNSESPFLNWTAVNFGAHTENATGLSLYAKGLTGGFNAYYDTLPVHEKIREYAGSESRDIRFFPLKISEKEYVKLMENLSNWKEKPYPYKFFTYNCTDGIYHLLFNSLDSLPPPKQKIMAPQDLVLILKKENRLEYPYLLPSLRERVLNSADKEQSKLEFMEWENSQKNAKKDTLREKEMAELRYIVSKKRGEKRNLFKLEKSFIKPHGYSRLDVGMQEIRGKSNASIRFRPLLHDQSDNSDYYSAYSTLELLALGLNMNGEGINLRELDLIHIRSAPIYDSLFRSPSWDFLIGYKNNYSQLNTGFGVSSYINKKRKIALEFLLQNSIKCENDFSCADFIGFETQLNKRWAGNFRYGAKFEYLHNIMDFENRHIQFKTWLSYDVNRSFNLYTENIFSIKKQEIFGLYVRLYI